MASGIWRPLYPCFTETGEWQISNSQENGNPKEWSKEFTGQTVLTTVIAVLKFVNEATIFPLSTLGHVLRYLVNKWLVKCFRFFWNQGIMCLVYFVNCSASTSIIYILWQPQFSLNFLILKSNRNALKMWMNSAFSHLLSWACVFLRWECPLPLHWLANFSSCQIWFSPQHSRGCFSWSSTNQSLVLFLCNHVQSFLLTRNAYLML